MAHQYISAWDRDDQRRFAFPATQIKSGMIRRNINIPYFSQARKYLQAVVECYATGRCMIEGWDTALYARVLAACEVAGVAIPDNCFATEQIARKNFIRCTLHFLCSRGSWTNPYSIGNDRAEFTVLEGTTQAVLDIVRRTPADNPPANADTFIRRLAGIDAANQITDADYTEDLAEAVAQITACLCARPTAKTRSCGTNQYVCVYVGVGKRGTVSANKLLAINQAVANETNQDINVTEDQIRATGTVLGTHIDETNAAQVMRELAQNIDNLSLRLKLTVQQTLRSGMTQYWSILEAMTVFREFDWDRAARHIPDDFRNFQRAITAVAANEYYGFRKELGQAAHTHYKSLGWLAVQLLIAHKGAQFGSLRQYRGVARHPDRQQELQALIDAYVPPAEGAALPELPDILTAARGVLTGMAAANRGN